MNRITTYDQLAAALSDRTMYGMDSRQFGELIRCEGLWVETMRMAACPARSGPKGQLAFRAAWALEKAYFADRNAFEPYMERFLDDFVTVRNPSVHRSYTKMLADMMSRNNVCLEGARAEKVAETCFDFLIDPGVRVAVKVWAMEILRILASRVDWVAENLRDTLLQLVTDGSPAMVVSVRRVLKKMEPGQIPGK